MTRRQLTIKPSCMREIATFPSDRAALLWDKIDALVSDPLPDGKVRKKLKGADGVYRMRVTDHRVKLTAAHHSSRISTSAPAKRIETRLRTTNPATCSPPAGSILPRFGRGLSGRFGGRKAAIPTLSDRTPSPLVGEGWDEG